MIVSIVTYNCAKALRWNLNAACVICLSFLLVHPVASAEITVVFRLDDYSPTCDVEAHETIFSIFEAHRMPVSVGVIPFRAGDGAKELLALEGAVAKTLRDYIETGVVEPALHGYTHTIRGLPPDSEFTGMPRSEQFSKIVRGKRHLEKVLQCPIDIFIPPFNAYDETTVSVLEEAGFKVLSADRRLRLSSEGANNLALIPDIGYARDLEDAIGVARNGRFVNPHIVVLFHSFNFIEVDSTNGWFTYAQFNELLEWVASQDDVQVSTFSDLLLSGNSFDASTYESDMRATPQWVTARWDFPYSLIPPVILPTWCIPYPLSNGAIMSDEQILTLASAYYILACVLGFLVGILLRSVFVHVSKQHPSFHTFYILGVLFFVFSAPILLYLTGIGYNSLFVCIFVVGFAAGTCLGWLRTWRSMSKERYRKGAI